MSHRSMRILIFLGFLGGECGEGDDNLKEGFDIPEDYHRGLT